MDALRSNEEDGRVQPDIGRSFLGLGLRPSSRATAARRSFRGERSGVTPEPPQRLRVCRPL
jgi:hypothetical protein